jgi:hypothetical protein
MYWALGIDTGFLKMRDFLVHPFSSLALALLLVGAHAHADDLAPFTTDGCSSFPDGTPKNQNLWLTCCIKHDLAYWKGGTYQQRLDADLELEQCVAKAGEPDIAKVMLQGVRAGGSPVFPTPYRWGYGWPFGRGYKELTEQEWEQVRNALQAMQALLEEIKPEAADSD